MRYIPGKESSARPRVPAEETADDDDDDEFHFQRYLNQHPASRSQSAQYPSPCAAPVSNGIASAANAGPSAEGYNSDDERASRAGQMYSSELEFINALWRNKRWQVIKMREDGACLFRSVAFHVYGDQEMHGQVRRLCMDYMVHNRDHFSEFITEDFDLYIERKRHEREHGNHVEIQAMSEMYSRCIEVYHYSDHPLNIFQAHCNSDAPIRLLYHGAHYDAIIDPNQPSFGVGLGFTDLRPGEADRRLLQSAEEASISQAMVESVCHEHDLERTQADLEAAILAQSREEYERAQLEQFYPS